MKNNRANFISSTIETSLLALIFGLFAVMAAKAEIKLDASVLNGLFTPTQSERFFEAGREDFEREIEIFTHPERYLREDLLQIDPELRDRLNEYPEPTNALFDNFNERVYSKVRIINF